MEGGHKEAVGNPPLHWTEHEKLAHSLALFKFSHIARDVIASQDYRKHLHFFTASGTGWFWLLMHNCLAEINAFADETGHDVRTAQAILLHDYVSGQRTLQSAEEFNRTFGSLMEFEP